MVNYHDLFSQIGAENAIKKKVTMLQDNESPNLKAVLRSAFDKRITWTVPNTKPPYEPNETDEWDDVPLKLHEAIMGIGRFANINGKPTNQARQLTRMQREQAFIDILSKLHKHEADIMISLLKRKINYKGITPRLVNQAFPELLPDE